MTDPIRVLLVDDQPEFTELTSTFLESSRDGFTVHCAHTVDQALQLLEREAIECVVSDYEMPSMDGLEFLAVVRDRYPDLPFIMFTGRGDEAVASEAITAGVTDYVQKRPDPAQYTVLANRIENVATRWRSELTLREQNRQRSTLFANLPGMVYRSSPDPAGGMEFVSQGCRDLTGFEPEHFMGGKLSYRRDVVHPLDLDRVCEEIDSAVEVANTYEVSYRIRPRDGGERWVWERGCGQFEAGTLVSLEGFVTDITERKRREREVHEHRRKVEALHQSAITITAAADETALFRRTVEAAERILDFDSCWIASVEDDRLVERVVSPGSSYRFTSIHLDESAVLTRTYREGRAQRVDDLTASEITGVDGTFRSTITVPFDEENVFQAISIEPSAFSDDDLELSELLLRYAAETLTRLRSQDELRAERDRFAALFRNVRDPIVQFDFDNDDPLLRDGNPAFEHVFGYDVEAVRGTSVDELIVPEERYGEAKTLNGKVANGDQIDTEIRRLTVDGPRDFLLRNVPVDFVDAAAGFVIYTDITEQKRRELALERQREQLLELNQINSLIRDITQALVHAETRESIEQDVCDRIASADQYTFAWIAGSKLSDTEFVPRTYAMVEAEGVEEDGIETIGIGANGTETGGVGTDGTETDGVGADETGIRAVSLDDSTTVSDAVVAAMDTGDVQVARLSEEVTTDERTSGSHASSPVSSAVAAIPLTARRANYGVLTVYADRRGAFDADEQEVLGELGMTIGHAIHAVEQRKLLTTNSTVELEFELYESEAFLPALADRLDCSLNLEGFFTRDDGSIVHYVTASSTTPELVLDAIAGFDEVLDGTLICEYDDELLFEFTTTDGSCVGVLAEFGAVVSRCTATSGNGELVASVAPDSDIRATVDAFQSYFPAAQLHAKREVDRPIQTVQQFRHTLDDRLTDKQRAALQAAYFARYFSWPRASTAEDVASSMGISSATLHYHLRKAQQKLLQAFFDDRE